MRLMTAALAAFLLLAPPLKISPAPPASSASAPAEAEPGRERRLWLILGGTVVGVTGMWAALYRRGKK